MVYRCLFRPCDALLSLNNTFVISIRYLHDLLNVVNNTVYSFVKKKKKGETSRVEDIKGLFT